MKQKKFNYLIKLVAIIMFVIVGSNVYAATNPYPKYQTIDGYKSIRCTYVAWKMAYEKAGVALPGWGNAKTWAVSARKAGYSVGTKPRKNSIVVWDDTHWCYKGHKYGHVGFIGDYGTRTEPGITDNFYQYYESRGMQIFQAEYVFYEESGQWFIYLDSKPAHTHKYGEWKITKAATCGNDGKQTRKCSCGVKETKTIKAKEHEYSTEWTIDKAATCEKDGSKSHHCKNCNSRKDITSIKATGHEYSTEWIIDKAATCEKDGSKSQHCKKCNGKKNITSIKATGHNYSKEWSVDKQPTCIESGSKAHICANCGSKKDIMEVAALGHNYGDYIVDVEATCTKDGEKSKYCTRCNNREDITKIEAIGHSYGEWIIKHKATDYEQGIKERVCVKCQSKEVKLLPRTYKTIMVLSILGTILLILTIILIVADIKYKKKKDNKKR